MNWMAGQEMRCRYRDTDTDTLTDTELQIYTHKTMRCCFLQIQIDEEKSKQNWRNCHKFWLLFWCALVWDDLRGQGKCFSNNRGNPVHELQTLLGNLKPLVHFRKASLSKTVLLLLLFLVLVFFTWRRRTASKIFRLIDGISIWQTGIKFCLSINTHLPDRDTHDCNRRIKTEIQESENIYLLICGF